MFWPMSINAGISGFFGPSVRESTEPRWGTAIVCGGALFVEFRFHPPYWVHAALWLPLILIVTLGPLRPMKGLMIALQFHHKAAESRFGADQP